MTSQQRKLIGITLRGCHEHIVPVSFVVKVGPVPELITSVTKALKMSKDWDQNENKENEEFYDTIRHLLLISAILYMYYRLLRNRNLTHEQLFLIAQVETLTLIVVCYIHSFFL
ncbi:hypothetical protein HNY73_015366 [Argiope bruennichi]|uniref:Uncharacterized protein n=1 Tax=Argiope bruennichi TaxID=94029 RepID=A0A8T0EWJ8_ARGBR|nr:hypothetical protein HNY73_015366 [Argiope bruennichi]